MLAQCTCMSIDSPCINSSSTWPSQRCVKWVVMPHLSLWLCWITIRMYSRQCGKTGNRKLPWSYLLNVRVQIALQKRSTLLSKHIVCPIVCDQEVVTKQISLAKQRIFTNHSSFRVNTIDLYEEYFKMMLFHFSRLPRASLIAFCVKGSKGHFRTIYFLIQ